jgi:hypothetical protein
VLEVLAGPFDRLLPDSSTAPSVPDAFWDDRLGLGGWHSAHGYYVTQLDGTTHQRARAYQMGRFAIDDTTDGWLQTSVTNAQAYPWDYASGTRTGAAVIAGGTNDADFDVRLPDRLLRARKSGGSLVVEWRPTDLSAGWVTEATVSVGGSGADVHVSRAGGLRYWLACEDGRTALYDSLAVAWLRTGMYLPAHDGAWYSPRLGVFVALDSDQVSVYAATPLPTTVAAPSGSPVRGRVNIVTTRVTGSNGEACPEELVDWALTAGSGEMIDAQSTTDDEGYATARYLAPMTGGTNPTIRAQVKC